jgi:hypothetical protein
MKHSKREIRAMAYRIVDEIETRALALMGGNPALSKPDAMALAIKGLANE